MDYLLKEDPNRGEVKAQPTHLAMAEEIANRVINEFSSEAQAEFLCSIEQQITHNYECQIKECKAHLESVQMNYNAFKGNLPKSN